MSPIEEKFGFGYKPQSVINTLRLKYKNGLEEAYLIELNGKIQYCKYCNDKSKFISIFKGYDITCKSEQCKKKSYLEKCKINGENKRSKELITYICKSCNEPFSILKNSRSSRSYCKSEYCKSRRGIKFLNYEIIKNFNLDKSYLNNLAFELMQKYKYSKVVNIFYKNLDILGVKIRKLQQNILKSAYLSKIINPSFKPENFKLTKDGKFFIKEYYYTNRDIKHIYGDEYEKYIYDFHPEKTAICKVCNKKYIHTNYTGSCTKSLNTCNKYCHFKNAQAYVTNDRNLKVSNSIKNRIKEGTYTPNAFNSFTRKNIILKKLNDDSIIKFRSSWEIIFYVLNYNIDLKYEELRVEYFFKNKRHIYIVDFINETTKTVYEIKPIINMEIPVNIEKLNTLKKWVLENNYKLELVNENMFDNITYENFEKLLDTLKFEIPEQHIKDRIRKLLK